MVLLWHSSPPSSEVLLSTVSVTHSQSRSKKYYVENPRNKQFIGFSLRAVLRSLKESRTVLLRPALDVNHPFVQHVLAVHAACQ